MSFVIAAMPAYNEERSIAKMVLGCKKYVDQVVVVDDGSSDAMAERSGAIIAAEIWSDYLEEPGQLSRSSHHSMAHRHLIFSLGVG
ncbi:MAG: hypothetical protein M0Q43_11365 [Methanothrix sp.]|jgi:hypothetical protein|nr:hypothetical protein [Methanothrix sp.]